MHVHDQCGRCGSRELLEVPPTPADHSHIVTGERLLHTVTTTAYVCTDCGHVERWVNSRADLRALKEAWLRQKDDEP